MVLTFLNRNLLWKDRVASAPHDALRIGRNYAGVSPDAPPLDVGMIIAITSIPGG
jgi:hypothetical protein